MTNYLNTITTSSDHVFKKAAQMLQVAFEHCLLHHKKFLLFLSGGSAVNVYKELVPWVKESDLDFSKSIIALVDERFGSVNHKGSNAQAIEKSGLFEAFREKGATVETMLTGLPLEKEAKRYNIVMRKFIEAYSRAVGSCHQLSPLRRPRSAMLASGTPSARSINARAGAPARATRQHGMIISVFGIGQDGHTAGIFPATKDKFEEIYINNNFVVSHSQGVPPYIRRITITPKTISLIDSVFVIAKGERKKEALGKFYKGDWEDRFEVPAVILKKARNVTVVTGVKI